MGRLSKGGQIGPYKVAFPVKTGKYAETYRVKDASGKNFFLKLINYAKLDRNQFNGGKIVEETVSDCLKTNIHLQKCYGYSDITIDGSRFAYIVYEYISGETLAQMLTREQHCSASESKRILLDVLDGLKFMHDLPDPVIHNEITADNVMLDLSEDRMSKIIDYGNARFMSQGMDCFPKENLNPLYLAPECFNHVFSKQTDLYAAGILLYHLTLGMPPYCIELSEYEKGSEYAEKFIVEQKKKPLTVLDGITGSGYEEILKIVQKATAPDVDNRFQSADEFMEALTGKVPVIITLQEGNTPQSFGSLAKDNGKGGGFADVAGMQELKAQLKSDVIDLLEHPQQAKELGLALPNGLLFYGPPGCGKTYFAEKFAEEAGCNYRYVKCSDIASPYIHGGQGKIAAIFDDARKNAPTILFFDEIDAMIKDRGKQTNVSEAGEVNEFLAQLNNCGKDGVIVIGATNKPSEIDEAALRAGRLEFKYYIPQPDHETRTELFRINLQNRKTDFGIDYGKLADLTENYVSADIKLIVDTAARTTFRKKLVNITMGVLEEAIANVKPSLTEEMIRRHEEIRDAFQGKESTGRTRKIGF